jgi:hypothetical protein
VDTVRDFFRFLMGRRIAHLKMASGPLVGTLKNRQRMRSVILELLPREEMARTEGTVDAVELNRPSARWFAARIIPLRCSRDLRSRKARANLPAQTPKFLIGYDARFSNDSDLKDRRRTSEPSRFDLSLFRFLVPLSLSLHASFRCGAPVIFAPEKRERTFLPRRPSFSSVMTPGFRMTAI